MRRASLNLVSLLALVVGLSAFAPGVRADLLDEEEPTVGTGTKTTTKPDEPKPVPPKSTSGKTGTGTKAPAPQPGPAVLPGKAPGPASQPSPGATVTAPKTPTKGKPAKKENEPVHFESKGLKGLREKGMVELVDDVIITQGDLRMEAKHAQVFFDEAAKDVLKVIAEGDVKITSVDPNTGEKVKAFGNQVVFHNKERTVVLDGNARLWRGDDSVIRGKKITYEMDSGWIKADRVAGELSPTEKDKEKK